MALTGDGNHDHALTRAGEDYLESIYRLSTESGEPDGSVQLAYPRGPAGTQTFMARLGPDGKLLRIDKVLRPEVFARIQPGMTQEQVLRLIGPPQPHWTQYFKARDELVWEWLFCDNWNQEAFFDVLFDGTSKLVRSTMQRQNLNGWDGVPPGCGQ